jgi:hypothetical protein
MYTTLEVSESTSTSIAKSTSSDWFPWRGLYINLPLFEKGIVVVSATNGAEENHTHLDGGFSFKKGRFVFSSIKNQQKSLQKTVGLANQLLCFATKSGRNIRSLDLDATVLVNQSRHEEVFLPIAFNENAQHGPIGVYLYPWATKSLKSKEFSGCSKFVTAGCVFGARMLGYNSNGEEIKFLDHNLQWDSETVITAIHYNDQEANPFELVVFSECEKICLLIDSFVAQNQPKQLLYHLPAYDYILFCVNLFVRGNMTYEALNDFIHACLIKKRSYEKRIGGICASHGIEVIFNSPFDNIFNALDLTNPTSAILACLQIDLLQQPISEEQLVAICIKQLQDNSSHLQQNKIWQDFFAVHSPETIKNLESLLKLGNAVIVALAAYGKQNFETCVLLPLSEKQIQVGYNNFSQKCVRENFVNASLYPNTLNFTVFDPLITYSSSADGLLFYCSCHLEIISAMIEEKKITEHAARNLVSPNTDLYSLFAASPVLRSAISKENIRSFSSQSLSLWASMSDGATQSPRDFIGDDSFINKEEIDESEGFKMVP